MERGQLFKKYLKEDLTNWKVYQNLLSILIIIVSSFFAFIYYLGLDKFIFAQGTTEEISAQITEYLQTINLTSLIISLIVLVIVGSLAYFLIYGRMFFELCKNKEKINYWHKLKQFLKYKILIFFIVFVIGSLMSTLVMILFYILLSTSANSQISPWVLSATSLIVWLFSIVIFYFVFFTDYIIFLENNKNWKEFLGNYKKLFSKEALLFFTLQIILSYIIYIIGYFIGNLKVRYLPEIFSLIASLVYVLFLISGASYYFVFIRNK